MSPYQYVLVRYRHNASAGEFANVGLVLWSPDQRDFLWRISSHYSRLSDFFVEFDGPSYRQMARRFGERFSGLLDSMQTRQPSLFERCPENLWEVMGHIQPEDASCFQWSEIRGGVDGDLAGRFERLWEEFVGRYEHAAGRDRVDEARIREQVTSVLRSDGLLDRVQHEHALSGGNYTHVFPHMWVNGRVQVLDTISLDLSDATRIIKKATLWAGRLLCLSREADFQMTGVVAPPADPDHKGAYEDAVAILSDGPNMREVVPVGNVEAVAGFIREDLSLHDGEEE